MANPFDQFDQASPAVAAPTTPAVPLKGTPFVTENSNPFDRFDAPKPVETAPKEDWLGQGAAGLVKGIPNAVTGFADAQQIGQRLGVQIPGMDAITGFVAPMIPGLREAVVPPTIGRQIKEGMSAAHINPDDYFRAPETPGERIAEMAGEGLITSIVSPNKANGWAKLLEIGKELGIGAAAGAGAQGAMEVAPDWADPFAGLIGGIGSGVAAAGIMGLPGAAARTVKRAGAYVEPAVAGRRGVERMAGARLAETVGNKDAAIAALGSADELVPGSRPTAFQAVGDVGLGSLERALARGDDEFKAKLLERNAQQNEARLAALDAIQESGNPSLVADFFRGRMRELETRADEISQLATGRAKTAHENLGERPAGEIGDEARGAMEAEFKRLNGETNRLWNSIDPDGTLNVVTEPLVRNTAKIYGAMSPEEMLSLSAREKDIAAIIGGYGETLPFQRFKDLRSEISSAMREAKIGGQDRAYGRLSRLRTAIEEAVSDSIAGKMDAEPSLAADFVRKSREWYENRVAREAGAGPAPGAVGATAAAARGVPEGPGAGGTPGGIAAAPARDSGIPEDAAARSAVEGGGRFDQGAKYPLAPRSEWYGEANYEAAGGKLTEMTPDEFLARSRPLKMDEVTRDNIDDLKRHIQSGKTLDPLKFFDGGREDGRHRAIAAKELGIQRVPVVEFGDQVGRTKRQTGALDQSGTVSNPGAESPRPFYSAALKAVEDSKTNRASPQQWAATIKNTPGVKQEELDWMGLNSWLAAQKGAVTKEQVADFIRANQIEVEEVNLSGAAPHVDSFRIDWEPDEPDADFVREVAQGRVADEADDLREQVARQEDIEPEDVTDDQIEEMAFENEMRYREQEPDWHASVVVDRPDGEQMVYDIYRSNDGYTNITRDGLSVGGDGSMDEADIREAIHDDAQTELESAGGDGPAQYGEYTLPGGKDYHELLLKLPEREKADVTRPSAEVQAKYKDQWDALVAEHRALTDRTMPYDEFRREKAEILQRMETLNAKMVEESRDARVPWQQGENFDAPHYDDQSQNILAHIRFKDRTSVDGKRTLFLEEVQSDWHQQGRDKGYKQAPAMADDIEMKFVEPTVPEGHDPSLYPGYWESFDKRTGEILGRHGGRLSQDQAIAQAIGDANLKASAKVPNAPFKTTWPELALKRMIRWAADNGYDQVAWTPGSVQNARYNLSTQVDGITWNGVAGEEKVINVSTPGRVPKKFVVDKDGRVVMSPAGLDATGKPLSEVLGKDLAAQIMADEAGTITKNGLAELGGSGMREFYDRVMVSLGNKLGKKFGTQVGKTEIAIPRDGRDRGLPRDENLTAAALPITPEMREGALKGQPLFQKAHEAATSPTNDLPEPTAAQKEAGNYKKGHVRLGGLDLAIENPVGSKRKGVSADGKPWSTEMKDHYGYIRGTVGRDKDHIDAFIKDGAESLDDASPVFVVDQVNPKTGKLDEHKVMLGYPDRAAAIAAYKANYAKGWMGMGEVTATTLGTFKDWLKSGKTTGAFAKSGYADADRPIAARMAERFAGAGRPKAEAQAAGQIVDAFYATMAKRLHKTIEEVLEIFPLPDVQKGGGGGDGLKQGPRGQISFGAEGTPSLIKMFEKADASTAVHESAHQFMQMFRQFAEAADAPEPIIKDWKAAKAWWDKNANDVAKDGSGDARDRAGNITAADVRKVLRDGTTGDVAKDAAVNRGMHEQWARAFETYLKDGKAPNPALRGVFEQFAAWLAQVYQNITSLGVNVSPEVRSVFDRMLGGESEAAGLVKGMVDRRKGNTEPLPNLSEGQAGGTKSGSGVNVQTPGGLGVQPVRDKAVVDRLNASSKSLANFLKRESLLSKQGPLLSVPTPMLEHMVRVARSDIDVLRSIVSALPVDVMDLFARKKVSPEDALRNVSVLRDALSISADDAVTLGIDRSDSIRGLVSAVASGAAERVQPVSLTGVAAKGSGAVRADVGDLWHPPNVSDTSSVSSSSGRLIDEAAAGRFKAATAATRNLKDIFGAKPVKAIRNRPGPTYPYIMSPEAVSANLWKAGPEGAANIENVLKAGASKETIEAAAILSAKRAASKDGALDPAKFEAWRNKHADALKAVPELDRRLGDAAAASRAMAAAGERGAAALDSARKTAVGKLLNVEADADVAATVGSMLNRSDAVKAMRELASQAAGDPNALEGLRRAVIDHMLGRLKTPKDALRADTFQRFVGKNAPALAQVLTPEQMANLRAIAQDLKRASRDVRAPGGGSDTAENLAARGKYLHDKPSILSTLLRQALGSSITGIAAHTFFGPIAGIASWIGQALGGTVLQSMRSAGIRRVDDLIKEAVLDPELMRALLMKAPKKKGVGSAVTFAQRLQNIAAINLALSVGQGQKEDQGKSRERRRADASGVSPMLGVRG